MILVFGSINIDLVFPVAELPLEGETVLAESYSTVPGGKGANQAVAAARALAGQNVPVIMVGAVGRDGFADLALQGLADAGVDLSHIRRSARPTGCAAIAVDHRGRNQITVASGANLDVSARDVADAALGADTIVLLQNEVPEDQNLALARRAAAAGARVIFNAAPARSMRVEDWAGVLHALIVNEGELFALAGSDDAAAAAALAEQYRTTVVATHGADGAFVCRPDGNALRIGAMRLERVVDTTAAGDCFVGVLASALREGEDLASALRRASVAAGLACTRPGAQTSLPTRTEILSRLSDLEPARPL